MVKQFCWPFSNFLILLMFITNFSNFVELFLAYLAIFGLLGLVSPVTYTKTPCAPRFPRPWCSKFGTSHITPDAPRYSWGNHHTTTPNRFCIMWPFSNLSWGQVELSNNMVNVKIFTSSFEKKIYWKHNLHTQNHLIMAPIISPY